MFLHASTISPNLKKTSITGMNAFGWGDLEYFCTIFVHFSTIINQTLNSHSYSTLFKPKKTFKKGTTETKS